MRKMEERTIKMMPYGGIVVRGHSGVFEGMWVEAHWTFVTVGGLQKVQRGALAMYTGTDIFSSIIYHMQLLFVHNSSYVRSI